MDISQYQSPYGNRYGTAGMRAIWSIKTERSLWKRFWFETLESQVNHDCLTIHPSSSVFGLVKSWMADVKQTDSAGFLSYTEHEYEEALELEKTTHHDLVAVLEVTRKQVPGPVRGALHLGCTSSDVEDYADLTRIRQSLEELLPGVRSLIKTLADRTDEWADTPVLGRTHFQPAEPTTLGHRLSVSLEELMTCHDELLDFYIRQSWSKGSAAGWTGGPVGTGAGMLQVWENGDEDRLPSEVIPSGQTYPRSLEVRMSSLFLGLSAVLSKLAYDFRLMGMLGYMVPVYGRGYVGSSALPGKRNPITAERVCSLSRTVPGLVFSLWDTASNAGLERTLDDSAVRRVVLPELFLVVSELLVSSQAMLENTYLDARVARTEVVEKWQSWLMSRLATKTLRERPEIDRLKLVKELEGYALASTTAEAFLSSCLGQPMVEFVLEDWLYLDLAVQSTRATVAWVRRRLEE